MEIFIGIQDIVDVEPNQDHQRAQFRPQRKLQLPFLQLNLVLSFLKKKYTHILTLLSQDLFKFTLWCKVPIGEKYLKIISSSICYLIFFFF